MKRKENRFPTFQEKFRELQGELSNTEFAAFLGLSRQTVGFYCNGERIPDALGIRDIAQKCGVPSDWLLGLTEIPTENYTTRRISEITGISVEVIDFFISQEDYYKKTGDDLLGSFNRFFTAENLETILDTILLMRAALALGEAVCNTAQSELGEIAQFPLEPCSRSRSLDWIEKLEDAKRDIRYARFESIDAYTTVLDVVRNSATILKQIDLLINSYADVIDKSEE